MRSTAGAVARKWVTLGVLVGVFLNPSVSVAEAQEPTEPMLGVPWVGVDDDGDERIELYFVFSSTCPHCQAAIPFIQELAAERDWLRVWWLQADGGDPKVAEIAGAVAGRIGQPIRGVPTFMACGSMLTGYDDEDGMGAELVGMVDRCHEVWTGDAAATTMTGEEAVSVPVIGDVSSSSVPLPIFTAIVAGLDAFNPCAFFVLLFLLSLLVHARSRVRMAAVGLVFVGVSGILYFVFMAAWLNIFLVTGGIRWVTIAAGSLAVVLGLVSAKDSFRPDVGPSLSIPESAKPGLFGRMRGLVAADRLLAVMAATVALALVANSYELLCTAGLPMVFTRVLTLNDLSTPAYYAYLAMYNVVYVIPLVAIVAVFVVTLGSRKLSASEGRILKLLSGTMMLGLGVVLLVAPELLERVGVAILVIVAAVVVTVLISMASGLRTRTSPGGHPS